MTLPWPETMAGNCTGALGTSGQQGTHLAWDRLRPTVHVYKCLGGSLTTMGCTASLTRLWTLWPPRLSVLWVARVVEGMDMGRVLSPS